MTRCSLLQVGLVGDQEAAGARYSSRGSTIACDGGALVPVWVQGVQNAGEARLKTDVLPTASLGDVDLHKEIFASAHIQQRKRCCSSMTAWKGHNLQRSVS